MDATEPESLEELLETICDLDDAGRSAFLGRLAAARPDLHRQLVACLEAAAPADDFLERPAFVLAHLACETNFEPGEVLSGRFRVEELLGHGGMGDVYRAFDTELSSHVALKVLRGDISADPSALERFKDEILRARTVSHPNVCRVFDLFVHNAEDRPAVRFLTMELLDGESLAACLLRTGPLALVDALPIARQIASAVDEAHRLGIVHRDLKPANVMLTGTGRRRAVVTDFGLALDLSHGVDRAVLIAPAGTRDYMAPEQRVQGAVGQPADVYAFGVVVCEMLTGSPDRASAARLPRSWQRAIVACLDPDSALRPPTTAQVLEIATNTRLRRTVRAWAIAAAAFIIVATALYSPLSRLVSIQGSRIRSPDIVLAEFVNETHDSDLRIVTGLVRRQLEQSAYFNVLSAEQLADTLRQMVRPAGESLTLDVAREVVWRRGGGLVAAGRIDGADRGYVLSVRLETAGSAPTAPGTSWSRTYEARDRNELGAAIRQAANWIRATAGEAPAEIPKRDRPVAEVTTSSWKALDLYSQAETLLSAGRSNDGLAMLEEAVRIDPQFALAWMRLGDVLTSRRRYTEAGERWSHALAVYNRLQVTPREGYRLRGMYAGDTGDYADAERLFRLYRLAFPADPAPYFYLARPLLMLGRVDEAIAMLEEAQRRDPFGYHIPAQLAMFNLRAGRAAEAATHIARVRELGHSEWADCIQGAADFLAGNSDQALARFESLQKAQDALLRARATTLQADVLADTGRLADAAIRLQRGITLDEDAGARTAESDKLLALCSIRFRTGDPRAGRDACLRATRLDSAPARLTTAGSLLARGGYPDDGQALLRRLELEESTRDVDIGRQRVRGEILLARGQKRAGAGELQKAAAMEALGVMPEYDARAAEASGEFGTAISLYERMATSPGYYWRYPDSELPGTWSTALERFLVLARRHAPGTNTSAATRLWSLFHRPSPAIH
jgi:serine/threonine protein kinase/Flp pilus assembly protein TadD